MLGAGRGDGEWLLLGKEDLWGADENILNLNNDDRHTTLYIKPMNCMLYNGEY